MASLSVPVPRATIVIHARLADKRALAGLVPQTRRFVEDIMPRLDTRLEAAGAELLVLGRLRA